MPELKPCTRSVIPETHETIVLDAEGSCNICRQHEYKQTKIVWEAQKRTGQFEMYTVLVDSVQYYSIDGRTQLRTLAIQNIQTQPAWRPAHLSPVYRGVYTVDCSISERLYSKDVSLPRSMGLTPKEQVCDLDTIVEKDII